MLRGRTFDKIQQQCLIITKRERGTKQNYLNMGRLHTTVKQQQQLEISGKHYSKWESVWNPSIPFII
jgi:hypothetical protein